MMFESGCKGTTIPSNRPFYLVHLFFLFSPFSLSIRLLIEVSRALNSPFYIDIIHRYGQACQIHQHRNKRQRRAARPLSLVPVLLLSKTFFLGRSKGTL